MDMTFFRAALLGAYFDAGFVLCAMRGLFELGRLRSALWLRFSYHSCDPRRDGHRAGWQNDGHLLAGQRHWRG